jgi:hypothetical protein
MEKTPETSLRCDRDGDAAVVTLAGARVRPKLRAAPSSGTAVVPFWSPALMQIHTARYGFLPAHWRGGVAVIFLHIGGGRETR